MRALRPSRGRRAVLLGGLALFALLMLLQPLPRVVGQPLVWAVHVVTVLVAAVAMIRRGRAVRGRLRSARILIAGSMLCGAAGGLLAICWLLVTGRPPPEASLVDVVHFCYLPLVVAGLLRYPVTESEPGSSLRALLDGVVAAGGLWFVTYALLLAPARVGDGMPLLTNVVTLAHPASDVFVLGMIASVLPRVARRARRELAVTGTGLALFALADMTATVQTATGTYRTDSWVALLFEAGLLLMVAGAYSRETRDGGASRWVLPVTVLPQLPVITAILLACWIALHGDGIHGPQLLAGIVLVVALSLRQLISSRDRDVLTERLLAREELFRTLVTGASDLITLHDADGRVTWVSPSVERVFGTPAQQLVGARLDQVVDPRDRARVGELFTGVAARAGAQVEATVRLRDGSGEPRWMQVQLKNQLDHPSVQGIVGNARDVHERHVLERQLARAAFHDVLTGLGNLARTRALLGEAYERRREVTVVLVDLDGFKSVNDSLGHACGDELLCQVAVRLRSCLRSGDEVTRIGGDEFVLVLDGLRDARSIGARVLAALREPVQVAGSGLPVRASLGLALSTDADTPDELLRNADLAMYTSKAAGRDCATSYEPAMHSAATRRMELNRDLRAALATGEMALHYQPIVRLPDGATVGAEALLRWRHPVEGWISPEFFVPVAEESGIIADIDVWVLEQACLDIAAWRSAGLDVPRVSINVSRRHMTLDLPELVRGALARHGLYGDDLCLEVTESAVVPDVGLAARALRQVRELGVTVALDDFGTGESSLSQLVRLPVDSVKIDRSFTSTALSDPAALRLLTSIVGVCQSLALPVVAEGIEQQELGSFLADIGCEQGQGFHFGRPQDAGQFRRLLTAARVPHPRPVPDAGSRVPR